MVDWLRQLWDAVTAIDVWLLALGLVFQLAQTMLVALAWRNILRAAYPDAGVRYRPILSFYAGGVGLNAVLPASAGTVAMVGLFRARIRGSTVPGILGATFVQTLFFAFASGLVYLWLFLDVAGSFELEFGWFSDHPVGSIIILGGGGVLIFMAARVLYTKFHATWESAKEGGVILGHPRQFAVQVVGVEAASYMARVGVNATFMHAFGVPVSLDSVFLIVAASSISSTLALLPGAVGVQTALASVVLHGTAPASVISAYTVGQALITTAFAVVFGTVLLAREIGWEATRSLFHRKRRREATPPGAQSDAMTPP